MNDWKNGVVYEFWLWVYHIHRCFLNCPFWHLFRWFQTGPTLRINHSGSEYREKCKKNANGTISFHKASQKYRVLIPESWTRNNNNKTHMGLFASIEVAQKALDIYKARYIDN